MALDRRKVETSTVRPPYDIYKSRPTLLCTGGSFTPPTQPYHPLPERINYSYSLSRLPQESTSKLDIIIEVNSTPPCAADSLRTELTHVHPTVGTDNTSLTRNSLSMTT